MKDYTDYIPIIPSVRFAQFEQPKTEFQRTNLMSALKAELSMFLAGRGFDMLDIRPLEIKVECPTDPNGNHLIIELSVSGSFFVETRCGEQQWTEVIRLPNLERVFELALRVLHTPKASQIKELKSHL